MTRTGARSRIPPEEMYPAGLAGFSTRLMPLASGLRVRVVEYGAAGAAPVVLLSGWGGLVYAYRKNIIPLAAAGMRVIAVDLKGHGLSDKPDDPAEYTTGAMIAHVLEILDALRLSRARLVGQSMAGAIVARLALAAPERVDRFAVIGAVGFGHVPSTMLIRRVPESWLDWLDFIASRWTFSAVLRRAYGSLGRPTAHDMEEYYAPTYDPNFARALVWLLREFDWRILTPEEFSRFRMPMMIIFGTEDHVVNPGSAMRLAARAPAARAVLIRGAGHVANEEAPDLVNRALAEFLSP